MKLLLAIIGLIGLVLILVAFLVGGGDDTPSLRRRGSIPTATPAANPADPIVLGESRSGTEPVPTGGSAEITYVVRSGDTISAIAIRFGVPAKEQAAWIAETLRLNGIDDARLLAAGVEIRLPPIPATTVGPTATPATADLTPAPATTTPVAGTPTPRPTVVGGGGSYTVVEGDNPSLIGEKLGVPAEALVAWVDQLLALNDVEPTALVVGQTLELPAGTPGAGASPATTPTLEPTRTPVP